MEKYSWLINIIVNVIVLGILIPSFTSLIKSLNRFSESISSHGIRLDTLEKSVEKLTTKVDTQCEKYSDYIRINDLKDLLKGKKEANDGTAKKD